VPVDFERDDLGDTLVGAGFQQNSPAFFTQYRLMVRLP
jgi:O-methyltransferase involved in polyketide biosynthesis